MLRRRLLLLAAAAAAAGYDNGLARLPPMGWNSWCTDSLCNAAGKDPCSEAMVRGQVDAMVSQGLVDLGYKWASLDDCWSATTRDADGHLQPDASAFPNGMAAVADYVHSKGMYFGVYTSIGTKTCKGDRPGSYGHYEDDAKTLASWGVDLIKMDYCGKPGNESGQDLYTEMSSAMNATGRPMLFSLCNWGEDEVWKWGAGIAQMFRIQQDHLPFWTFPFPSKGQSGYGAGTKEIIEWMAHLQPSRWTQAHGWLDPDFLMTEYLDGTSGMGFVPSRTEFTFWALWSSPLQVSTDLKDLSADKRAILTNPEVIAVNQDPSATAGDRVRNETGGGQLWARDLTGGDKAVVLYNSGGLRAATVSASWADLGWAGSQVRVRDLWAQQDLNATADGYSASVAPRDVVFLRVAKLA